MEDVLGVYGRPVDPARPLVCFDEGGKELQDQVRAPQPAGPGGAAKQDYEYARHGSANLFLAVAPHLGWRQVAVTERRRAVDFAHALRDLVDHPRFAEAEKIVLVLDNLNTHTAAALYDAFPAAEAYRIWQRCEVHHTPKHGSWLNMAELELSVLARQCLDRRVPDQPALAAEVAAWTAARNAAGTPLRWSFTIADARVRLPRLYPDSSHDTIP